MRVRILAVALAAGLLVPSGGAVAQRAGSGLLYPDLGNAGYDVKHYDIELSWFAGTDSIDARTTITARATTGLDEFWLDLRGLTVSSVKVAGTSAAFTRHGHKLVVTPDDAISSGQTFTTVVKYAGKPKVLNDPDGSQDGWMNKDGGGAIVLAEPQGAMTWFPNNNTPSDKALFDVEVKVPSGYQAVSNGRNTSVVANAWHWKTTESMATYLATVAIGKYDRTTTTVDGIRYDSFVAKALPPSTKVINRLPKVIAFEEKYFGPYPFADAGVLIDNPNVFYALELQNRPFFPGTPGTILLVHELAHQWFGDSVSLDRWNDIWLNEGFATYAEWLWSAKHDGLSTAKKFRKVFANTASWKPAPMRVKEGSLFSDPVYFRGAMTLQALRERVGTKDFFRTVRRWTADHRHVNGTTTQFKRLAEKVSGRQLDKLFRDWLYVAKRPRGYVG